MKNYPLYLICLLLFFGCKTISIESTPFRTSNQSVSLTNIIQDKTNFINSDYEIQGLINIRDRIKINLKLEKFTKNNVKFYNKNFDNQVEIDQDFLVLSIVDKITFLRNISLPENKGYMEYLQVNDENLIVTKIALVLNDRSHKGLLSADEVFLENSGIKSQSLVAYNDKKVIRKIKLSEVNVFAYSGSSACWKENEKQTLSIVDLVNSGENCPNKTYKSSSRAKKKVNYFRY